MLAAGASAREPRAIRRGETPLKPGTGPPALSRAHCVPPSALAHEPQAIRREEHTATKQNRNIQQSREAAKDRRPDLHQVSGLNSCTPTFFFHTT